MILKNSQTSWCKHIITVIQEVEVRGLQLKGHPDLLSKLKTNLGYLLCPCLKNKKKKQNMKGTNFSCIIKRREENTLAKVMLSCFYN